MLAVPGFTIAKPVLPPDAGVASLSTGILPASVKLAGSTPAMEVSRVPSFVWNVETPVSTRLVLSRRAIPLSESSRAERAYGKYSNASRQAPRTKKRNQRTGELSRH